MGRGSSPQPQQFASLTNWHDTKKHAIGAKAAYITATGEIPQFEVWLDSHAGMAERLLYVNPPRTGLEPEVLAWVVSSLRPARLAYLSCSAGTLRRDLDVLTGSGYRVERITPYDFFPQTYHVETLALLREDRR